MCCAVLCWVVQCFVVLCFVLLFWVLLCSSVVLCCAALCCCVVLKSVVWGGGVLRYVALCCLVLCGAVLHCVVLSCVVSCWVALCCFPNCTVLWCAVLWCDVIYWVVLCWVELGVERLNWYMLACASFFSFFLLGAEKQPTFVSPGKKFAFDSDDFLTFVFTYLLCCIWNRFVRQFTCGIKTLYRSEKKNIYVSIFILLKLLSVGRISVIYNSQTSLGCQHLIRKCLSTCTLYIV